MSNIDLSQDELKVLVGTLSRIQCTVYDARPFLPLIDKLDSFIEKPQPQEVPVHPAEAPATVEEVSAEPAPVLDAEVV